MDKTGHRSVSCTVHAWRWGAVPVHTRDLILLSERKPTAPLQQPSWLSPVETPLVVEEWSRILRQHLDEAYNSMFWKDCNMGFVLASDMGATPACLPKEYEVSIV